MLYSCILFVTAVQVELKVGSEVKGSENYMMKILVQQRQLHKFRFRYKQLDFKLIGKDQESCWFNFFVARNMRAYIQNTRL